MYDTILLCVCVWQLSAEPKIALTCSWLKAKPKQRHKSEPQIKLLAKNNIK